MRVLLKLLAGRAASKGPDPHRQRSKASSPQAERGKARSTWSMRKFSERSRPKWLAAFLSASGKAPDALPDRTSAGCLVSSVSKSTGCSPLYTLSLVPLSPCARLRPELGRQRFLDLLCGVGCQPAGRATSLSVRSASDLAVIEGVSSKGKFFRLNVRALSRLCMRRDNREESQRWPSQEAREQSCGEAGQQQEPSKQQRVYKVMLTDWTGEDDLV